MNFTSRKNIFTRLFNRNAWEGRLSRSGPGSSLLQTQVLVPLLPEFLRKHDINSILDIPCGDFHWMSTVDLSGFSYTGGDIVDGIIDDNRKCVTSDINFRQLDIVADPLPCVDVIFCRDCLVHFSFKDIFAALDNMCNSGSTWLMTTFFANRPVNEDIDTGSWRPLNLCSKPFGLPSPADTINEQCSQQGGIYSDKSMGLWKLSDIRQILHNTG